MYVFRDNFHVLLGIIIVEIDIIVSLEGWQGERY